jgi:predicted ATPase/DNA-binding SARP family transcriptional activator
MLEIFTLGNLCIRLKGEMINDISLRKAEALLVYLAVNNRPIQRSVLAGLLWPEYSQTKALTSLRSALAALNRKISDYLDITRESVQISHKYPYYMDVHALEQDLSEGQIDAALERYTGDFLASFHVLDSTPFEDWQLAEQTRIRDALIRGLHESILLAITTRDINDGLKLAHKLLDLDAYDEIAHQGCILFHALSGDRAAALTHYQKCVEILDVELNIQPLDSTQNLYRLVSKGEEPNLTDLGVHKHNLPRPTTSFVGRKIELFQINNKLKDPLCRLITLVGPGGIGKTRLAIEAGRLASGAFPDGVYFVAFDELYSEEAVVPAIANAMSFSIDIVTTRLDPLNQLLDFLQRRVVLLILDGFEGLISWAAFLGRMLERVPGLKIMVTSRQSLNTNSEWLYTTEGLTDNNKGQQDLPIGQVEAVRLFVDRAIQVNHNFIPSERCYQSIARICQMVGGMPLAIELAAAWVGVMSVENIEKELSANMDILSTERVDVPEKHHSIRIVFDNAWDLLSDAQQNLLRKLSIFESSFDQQAVVEVAQGEISQLSSLVKKSMVHCDDQGRFNTHNLIRMFVYEKLAREAALLADVRENYCSYYLDMLTDREGDMMGGNMEEARQLLREELYHIQKATQWALNVWDQVRLVRVLTATLVLFAVYAWYEGVDAFRRFSDEMVEKLIQENAPKPEHHPVVLVCRVYQAFLQTNLGQIEESEQISQRCLKPLHEMGFTAVYSVCLHNLGVNASFRGDYETGLDLLEQAVIIGRETDFVLWPTYLLWLGHAYLMLGEYEAGLISLQKCREIFLEKETKWGAAFAISKIGLAYDGMGDHRKALENHREALAVFSSIGNIAGKGYSLSRMSMSACFAGNYHQAIRYGEEAYQLYEEIGHNWGLASTLPRLGFAHLGLGEVKEARAFFLRGVNLSQKSDMTPLALYALAGIGCMMLNEGKQAAALDLLSYVLAHPKTPMAYLDQPLGMLNPLVQQAIKVKSRELRAIGELETISEIIERYRVASL